LFLAPPPKPKAKKAWWTSFGRGLVDAGSEETNINC
jgi:hypothetical protein